MAVHGFEVSEVEVVALDGRLHVWVSCEQCRSVVCIVPWLQGLQGVSWQVVVANLSSSMVAKP